MALSGVRSSWLMVARKRLLEASACSAAVRARSSACSWILRSVMSRITATTSASGEAAALDACPSGRQRISTQMKSTELFEPRSPPRGTSRLRRNSTLRSSSPRAASDKRREIGRPVGDMNAVEQAVRQQPRRRRAEHGLGGRRNELHGAVAVMTRNHVAHVPRQQPVAVFLDREQRHAGARQQLRAECKPRSIERARCDAKCHAQAAQGWIRRRQHSEMAEHDQQCGAGQRQSQRQKRPRGAMPKVLPPAESRPARSRQRIRCRRC